MIVLNFNSKCETDLNTNNAPYRPNKIITTFMYVSRVIILQYHCLHASDGRKLLHSISCADKRFDIEITDNRGQFAASLKGQRVE